jgi:prepilin-type N-terminal cleavage/methylation domain-containing protein
MSHVFPQPGHSEKGFTLIELLLVMGIVGGLLAIVIIALNPGKQLRAARDVERRMMVQAQSKALMQYLIDKGQNVSGLPAAGAEPVPICRVGVTDASCVTIDVVAEEFITSIPEDKDETSEVATGYRVFKSNLQYVVCNDYLPVGDPMRCSNSTAQDSGSSSGGSSSAASNAASVSSAAVSVPASSSLSLSVTSATVSATASSISAISSSSSSTSLAIGYGYH